ncbi:MAG: MauE/DoxX family redox-associated membrane protein [Phycisphaerales bacterium]
MIVGLTALVQCISLRVWNHRSARLEQSSRLPAPGSQLPQYAVVIGVRLATLSLGVLYFVTAISKGTQVARTASVVESILFMGSRVSYLIVLLLVAVELVLAGMLIGGYRLKIASLSSLVLSVVFLLWHLLVWIEPWAVNCGCGAPPMIKKLISESHAGLMLAGIAFVLSSVALFGCLKSS